MSTFYNEIPGDLFQETLSQQADMLDKVQAELKQASKPVTTRMAKAVAAGLNNDGGIR